MTYIFIVKTCRSAFGKTGKHNLIVGSLPTTNVTFDRIESVNKFFATLPLLAVNLVCILHLYLAFFHHVTFIEKLVWAGEFGWSPGHYGTQEEYPVRYVVSVLGFVSGFLGTAGMLLFELKRLDRYPE